MEYETTKEEMTNALIDSLEAVNLLMERNAVLLKIAEELAKSPLRIEDGRKSNNFRCLHCAWVHSVSEVMKAGGPSKFVHAPECPITKLRELQTHPEAVDAGREGA